MGYAANHLANGKHSRHQMDEEPWGGLGEVVGERCDGVTTWHRPQEAERSCHPIQLSPTGRRLPMFGGEAISRGMSRCQKGRG